MKCLKAFFAFELQIDIIYSSYFKQHTTMHFSAGFRRVCEWLLLSDATDCRMAQVSLSCIWMDLRKYKYIGLISSLHVTATTTLTATNRTVCCGKLADPLTIDWTVARDTEIQWIMITIRRKLSRVLFLGPGSRTGSLRSLCSVRYVWTYHYFGDWPY